MKTIQTQYFLLTVFLILISCSHDSEVLDEETSIKIPQEKAIPPESSPLVGAIGTPGFPKSLKKYQNGNLYYWAQYNYRTDGNIGAVQYSHPESGPEIFTDTYYYNTEGKLLRLEGHDVYNFHWDKNRIVEADKYNAMWHGRSKIFYTYNPEGQIIQRTENNLDFGFKEKIIYSYFEDGHLKTIEQYGDYNESGIWTLYFVTNFEGYEEDKNLFLELEIIPGQIAQHQFPSSMSYKHLTAPDYDLYEAYQYKYDTDGRVSEKVSGSNKVVYQYH